MSFPAVVRESGSRRPRSRRRTSRSRRLGLGAEALPPPLFRRGHELCHHCRNPVKTLVLGSACLVGWRCGCGAGSAPRSWAVQGLTGDEALRHVGGADHRRHVRPFRAEDQRSKTALLIHQGVLVVGGEQRLLAGSAPRRKRHRRLKTLRQQRLELAECAWHAKLVLVAQEVGHRREAKARMPGYW